MKHRKKQEDKRKNLNEYGKALTNQSLADALNIHSNEEEMTVAAHDMNLSKIIYKYPSRICDVFRHHEAMWNGRLSNINNAEHATNI